MKNIESEGARLVWSQTRRVYASIILIIYVSPYPVFSLSQYASFCPSLELHIILSKQTK